MIQSGGLVRRAICGAGGSQARRERARAAGWGGHLSRTPESWMGGEEARREMCNWSPVSRIGSRSLPRILENALRYLDSNPVRVGLAAAAWEWPWSSARAHRVAEAGDAILNCESLLSELELSHQQERKVRREGSDSDGDSDGLIFRPESAIRSRGLGGSEIEPSLRPQRDSRMVRGRISRSQAAL